MTFCSVKECDLKYFINLRKPVTINKYFMKANIYVIALYLCLKLIKNFYFTNKKNPFYFRS